MDLHAVVFELGMAEVARRAVFDFGAQASVERDAGVEVVGDDVDEIESGCLGHGDILAPYPRRQLGRMGWMDEPVAVGFRCHSGWAVMVAVSGTARRPILLERQRVDLLPPTLPRQPYHAVAEGGMARAVIGEVEAAAHRRAADLLLSVTNAVAVGVVAAERLLPDNLDAILKVHARLHAAEGRLYEQ